MSCVLHEGDEDLILKVYRFGGYVKAWPRNALGLPRFANVRFILMRIHLYLFLFIFSNCAYSGPCSTVTDPDVAYSYFYKMALEPIYENGQLSSLLIKELTENEQKEAVSCLEKAANLGHWKASYTLHDFYKNKVKTLGIEKDLEKSKYYYNMYLKLRSQAENRANNKGDGKEKTGSENN